VDGPGNAAMTPELLALMQNFELCYELPLSAPRMRLDPQLLPAAKLQQLAGWERPEDLVLRYRYDFLPKGMVSRLTVRLQQQRTRRYARDGQRRISLWYSLRRRILWKRQRI